MIPHCTNCYHWDEESAEENVEGLGFCLMSEQCHPEVPLLLLAGNRLVTIARVRGDFSCKHFRGKTVPHVGNTHDAHSSSEAD